MTQRSTRSRMALVIGLAVPLSGLAASAQDSPYRVSLLNAPAPRAAAPAPLQDPPAPQKALAAPQDEFKVLEDDFDAPVVEVSPNQPDAIRSPATRLNVLDRQDATPIGESAGPVEVVQERFPDGKVKIRREMCLDSLGNYILHGEWRMWDTNGNEVAAGEFQNGQRHGVWTRQLAARDAEMLTTSPYNEFQAPFTSQATFKDGKLHGKWIILDSQKRIVSEFEFVDGLRDGRSSWNYVSGKKMKQIDFRKGLIDGKMVGWDPNAKVIADDVYQEGRKLAPKVTNATAGQKKSEGLYLFAKQVVETQDDWWTTKPATYTTIGQDDRHGRWISWYSNGQKEYEGTYENNLPEGQFTWWYPNSQVRVTGTYKKGKAHGDWAWWFENGQKSEKGQYEDGEPTGSWAYWKPNGMLHHKSDFDGQQDTVATDADANGSVEPPKERTSLKAVRGLSGSGKL